MSTLFLKKFRIFFNFTILYNSDKPAIVFLCNSYYYMLYLTASAAYSFENLYNLKSDFIFIR